MEDVFPKPEHTGGKSEAISEHDTDDDTSRSLLPSPTEQADPEAHCESVQLAL